MSSRLEVQQHVQDLIMQSLTDTYAEYMESGFQDTDEVMLRREFKHEVKRLEKLFKYEAHEDGEIDIFKYIEVFYIGKSCVRHSFSTLRN